MLLRGLLVNAGKTDVGQPPAAALDHSLQSIVRKYMLQETRLQLQE
jgi:hypothetical protein